MPKDIVNPLALKVLESHGYPTTGLYAKSWDVFEHAGGPAMDFVFTVCDNAAGEVCPIWPGQNSGAALATVVGVLVEVPVMLSVIHIVKSTRPWYESTARHESVARIAD